MVDMTNKEYELFSGYVLRNYGIRLSEGKRTLVVSRLQNILLQNDFQSFSDYYSYMTSDKTGTAEAEFINKITTNYTYFMREPDHFDYFLSTVLPYLANSVKSRDLRIWSAGCSTGEEAYTLAIIINDYFKQSTMLWDTKLLATDISTQALEVARKGEYDNQTLQALSPLWRANYFERVDDEKSTVTDKIKEEVLFRPFNLTTPSFPFKKRFHVIFCRNVMIYFDLKAKKELIEKFYEHMEPGGYLFIGHSEAICRDDSKFKYIIPAVYRK